MIIKYEFTMTSHNDKLVIKQRLYGPALLVDGHDVLVWHFKVIGEQADGLLQLEDWIIDLNVAIKTCGPEYKKAMQAVRNRIP